MEKNNKKDLLGTTTETAEKENFQRIDQEIVSKFINKDHLTGHMNYSYKDFIESYLKTFFEKNSKILILTRQEYDTNLKLSINNYYLHFKKYNVEPIYYRGNDRTKKEVDSEFAIQNKITRELKLNVESYITKENEDGTKQQITKKTYHELGRIPLLINSEYDTFAKKDLEEAYYFIINGSLRFLYNILSNDYSALTVRTGKNVNHRYFGTTYNSLSNKPNLTVNKIDSTFFIKKTLKDKKVLKLDLIKLLRILNIGLPTILSLENKKYTKINILGFIKDTYSTSKIQICKNLLNDIYVNKELSFKLDDLKEEELHELVLKNIYELLEINYPLTQNWTSILGEQLLEDFSLLIEDDSIEKYPDSLEYKKIFSVKNHFIKVFESAFMVILEKIKLSFTKGFNLAKKTKSMSHIIRSETLKKTFRKYITQGAQETKEPSSESLSYCNKISLISAQRKVISLLKKEILHDKCRSLNPTKIGRLCPVHTPHSRSVGLVEHLALGCKISEPIPLVVLEKFVFAFISKQKPVNKIYLNHRIVGFISDEDKPLFIQKLLKLKNKWDLSFTVKNNGIDLRTTEGRLLRPFYVVEREKVLIEKLSFEEFKTKSISELNAAGYIRFLDTREELDGIIAIKRDQLNKKTSYLFINPAVTLSYSGNNLILLNNNAAHRAGLSIRLLDQAIGSKLDKADFKKNETKIEYMQYPEKSVLTSIVEEYSSEKIGQNLITAFGPGEVEEDALMMNKCAIERGLMNTIIGKRIVFDSKLLEDQNKYSYLVEDKLIKTEDSIDMESDRYTVDYNPDIIQKDSLPQVGALVNTEPVCFLDEQEQSLTRINSPNTPFYISEVKLRKTLLNNCAIEITFSKLRKLQIGDKLGTRLGIKGILSKLIKEYDCWIPVNGIYPSIIASNHSVNSRMILGALYEMIFSKTAVLQGRTQKMLPFNKQNQIFELLQDCQKVLIQNNMNPEGYESGLMVDALNDEVKYFMGPVKWYLLDHRARDKLYIRSHKGGTNILTRQPAAGRSVGGGLRVGEMEVNGISEHCAVEFLKDKLAVDMVNVKVCKCGNLFDGNELIKTYCPICEKEVQLRSTKLPYAFIIFLKILKGVNLNVTFKMDDTFDVNDTQENFNEKENAQLDLSLTEDEEDQIE